MELSDDLSEHIVSTGNVILGVFRYLVLLLPSGWVVRRSEVPPEITYTGEYNGIGYVVEGETHHYVTNLVSDESFQLTIKCRKLRETALSVKTKGIERCSIGRTTISGHSCLYVVGEKPVGLLKRDKMKYVNLIFNCEMTGRMIELHFLGRGSDETLNMLVRTLEKARCHS